MNKKLILPGLFFLMCLSCVGQNDISHWPDITAESRPWTRWWWHGSAVSKDGLTSELEKLRSAGIGGVEITPIFGARGSESRFVKFLSPEWVELFLHTLKEAKRLGLGVDMATGTGWPFGGPWVTEEFAPKTMEHKVYSVVGGQLFSDSIVFTQEPMVRVVRGNLSIEKLTYPIEANKNLQELAVDQVKFRKDLPLLTLMAYSDEGQVLDLTEKVIDNRLEWEAPSGTWKLYALFEGDHGKMVERAAPGGEGNVIDHFSRKALDVYLSKFDSAFNGMDISYLRGFFNDSYEVDDAVGQANWTPELFNYFEKRNHYDLKKYLPALFGDGRDQDTNSRVLSDYRATMGDLLYENFTLAWKKWAAGHHALVRNQAHGSPANILDLYGLVDIPETEGNEMLKIKFASSAANVMGKRLTSSESATWLDDHFLSSLAEVKESLDRYLLGGVNHTFYHGTAYSPTDEPWPGWLFYAAVHANYRNPWWSDFSTLNNYIGRIQAFLQRSTPDNDVLVYFPVYDRYAEPGKGLLEHFDIRYLDTRSNFHHSEVSGVGATLLKQGYAFDFISDRQIEQLVVNGKTVESHGITYKAILIPSTQFMPLETLRKLSKLHREGVPVLFQKNLPSDVPGLFDLEDRRKEFNLLKELLQNAPVDTNVAHLLNRAAINRETMVDLGIECNRKNYKSGKIYFVVNHNEDRFDGFLPITHAAKFATLFDPMTGMIGEANLSDQGVYIQLQPGESMIIYLSDSALAGRGFDYYRSTSTPEPLTGRWKLNFVKGGPALPAGRPLDELVSWPTLGDDYAAFSGTASYALRFAKPKQKAAYYRLDLGEVYESAVVYLNGEKLGTLIGPSYTVIIPSSKLRKLNELRVDVTNAMANRIIHMDKTGQNYRKFYNVNFPAFKRENSKDGLFYAGNWKPLDSGLLGKVTLEPMEKLNP